MDLPLYLFSGLLIVLALAVIVLQIVFRPRQDGAALRQAADSLTASLSRMEATLREELRTARTEAADQHRRHREELAISLRELRTEVLATLDRQAASTEDRLSQGATQARQDQHFLRESLAAHLHEVQLVLDRNAATSQALLRDQLSQLEAQQHRLVDTTEKKLEQMRETVDEKLQKTLSERLGQSFDAVGRQLEAVQLGLGEMRSLAQDVGGLKKILSNVKNRGTMGEIQLGMLLEQMLAPGQYEANVRTKAGSEEVVEFAIRLPGREEGLAQVYLPVDAKFPQEVYLRLQEAYDTHDPGQIETAGKDLEATIRRMARDIRDKYLDPPHTTDFGIMFLPFEGIYAEVIRRSALLEQLQREYKVTVTGPATLAAMLNSLQMGFRTLALQKRGSEVWAILGAVKTEFETFGSLLEKAQKQIAAAGDTIGQLQGTRTRAINRKLREVSALTPEESSRLLPGTGDIPPA